MIKWPSPYPLFVKTARGARFTGPNLFIINHVSVSVLMIARIQTLTVTSMSTSAWATQHPWRATRPRQPPTPSSVRADLPFMQINLSVCISAQLDHGMSAMLPTEDSFIVSSELATRFGLQVSITISIPWSNNVFTHRPPAVAVHRVRHGRQSSLHPLCAHDHGPLQDCHNRPLLPRLR